MKHRALSAWALLLIPALCRADLIIDKNNLQQLKDAIREMNEASLPLPPRKAPEKKAPAAKVKKSPANKPSFVPPIESIRPDAKPELKGIAIPLPAPATIPVAPAVPSAAPAETSLSTPVVAPAAEKPAPTAAEILAEHERIMRDSPSLQEELQRKHEEIVGNSPTTKETLEKQHRKILDTPPPVSSSPASPGR